MFKPALKLVVRLLPFMAAMVASVAIGASTRAPETTEATTSQIALHHRQPVLAFASQQRMAALAASTDLRELPLLARADTFVSSVADYPVGSLDTALTTPPPRPAPQDEVGQRFEWPKPDRWTSLLSTLALAAFFFLRRFD